MRLSDDPPIPKYWQLAEQLREKVARGELKPGDRLPSLAEMREGHNLSRPTVEKAHALLEKEGLIVRQHGAGVFVAEKQKKPVQGVIGLCGAGFNFNSYSSFWGQLMGGVRDAASEAGMQILVLDGTSRKGWEKADGVLICNWDEGDQIIRAPLSQPVTYMILGVPGESAVSTDDYQGTYVAARHLVDFGHQKIGYLYSHGEQPLLRQRLAAYHDALHIAGIKVQPSWLREMTAPIIYGNQIVAAARGQMEEWLESGWRETGCTALLCHNDETAFGVIQALQAAGLSVPGDVSVVGFDGTEFCDLVSPSLTSVEVPLREIGATGVRILMEQIHGERKVPQQIKLPLRVRQRESTARL